MHIEINYRNINHSETIDQHVHEQVHQILGRFEERLTRIEVHLADENAGKPGPDDKRCMIEARPRGMDPLVAEDHAEDLYASIAGATKKLQRVLTKRFEKSDA
ncbi:MAG: ribosome-associated translation inhibitor RaiA [Planctomycetota bacterium]